MRERLDHAAETILWPALSNFLAEYPDIQIDLVVDNTLRDIVAERYDAGVRPGETVAKGMIAMRIAPDMRMAVVGAPSYFARRLSSASPPRRLATRCESSRNGWACASSPVRPAALLQPKQENG